MSEDYTEIKSDIGELKATTSAIRSEMQDMKQSVSKAVDKISDSMAVLAGVTEKLNNNIAEQQRQNGRIDDIETVQDQYKEKFDQLKLSHDLCFERRKQEEEKIKNSPFNRAKDKFVEWVFVILIVLVVYILISNFKGFVSYMNSGKVVSPPEVQILK